jgi:hypothetical protein
MIPSAFFFNPEGYHDYNPNRLYPGLRGGFKVSEQIADILLLNNFLKNIFNSPA